MISFGGLNISLDRRNPEAHVNFISHAHSDHIAAARPGNLLLACDCTLDLVEAVKQTSLPCRFGHSGMRLLGAGHMLGSRQLLLDDEDAGTRTVYTGDFNVQRSLTSEGIDIVDTDTLIIDSTYPDPGMRFAPKDETMGFMQSWAIKKLIKGPVLFNVYAMGKAQEVIAILNDVGIRPVVSRKVGMISGIYAKHGVRLDYTVAGSECDEGGDLAKGDFVGVSESRLLSSLLPDSTMQRREYSTAVATGWSVARKFDVDMQFPLSDHADFTQSLDYINATGAKGVMTYGPQAERFAHNLRMAGINAVPFAANEHAWRGTLRASEMNASRGSFSV